jgi:hypothetical protein
MFAGKVVAYSSGADVRLKFYGMELITAVKSFIVSVPGG